jgi:hypothetical protein
LAPSVYAVAIDRDMVFLDTAADSYFCLPQGASLVAQETQGRELRFAHSTLAEEFARAGLIEPLPGRAAGFGQLAAPAPRSSALRPTYPRPLWRDAREAADTLIETARFYRRKPFHDVLHRAQCDRPPVADTPSQALLDAVDRFHRWVSYAPVSGKCFLRSFMLLRRLAREGHSARWVIGVTTWPFRAHCWLQSGDVVLDDDHDRVAAYAPILTL